MLVKYRSLTLMLMLILTSAWVFQLMLVLICLLIAATEMYRETGDLAFTGTSSTMTGKLGWQPSPAAPGVNSFTGETQTEVNG